ncbi:hypothetical protein [Nesterenkonia jeotgali]|uniref:hypothetical protein n=1 Tax=Nesterenkonia jeotgali TaxID=317018 RepID=UPI000B3023D7|nr:hypothetical protein [Nesterenkonia jeotgali]
MEPPILILVGSLMCVGGVLGLRHYKKVHKMFTGSPFEDAPAELLFMPLGAAVGMGALFVFLGLDGI